MSGQSTEDGPPSLCCCAEPWATCSSDPIGFEETISATCGSFATFFTFLSNVNLGNFVYSGRAIGLNGTQGRWKAVQVGAIVERVGQC